VCISRVADLTVFKAIFNQASWYNQPVCEPNISVVLADSQKILHSSLLHNIVRVV